MAAYDRLLREFPESRYHKPSLYNVGLALEGLHDYAGAIERYRALSEKYPATRDALDALFRRGACHAELEQWPASAEAFARLLDYPELSVGDRVEAMGRRGLAQYKVGEAAAAERTFRDTLAYYRAHESEERLDSDFFLALSAYYVAEIAHDRFRALSVSLPEQHMRADLEGKAQLLLAAQARYVDVARIRNPAWATAAGYQMAMLYREMYDALMGAPVPPQLSGEAKQIYFEELRKMIEPLLRKAIHAHELTQQVAERSGVDNDWVRKSNAQLDELRALLAPHASGSSPPAAPPPEKVDPPPLPDSDSRPRTIL